MEKQPSILIVGWFPFPFGTAASSRIRTLSKGLVESGARVHVVSTCRTPWREEDCDPSGKLRWNGISYETLNVYTHPNAVLSKSARFINHVKAVLSLPLRVRTILEESSFDGVYMYGRAASFILPLLLVSRKRELPVFTDQVEWFTSEAFKWDALDFRFYDELLGRKLLLRYVTAATVITHFIKNKFVVAGKPALLLPSVYDFSNAVRSDRSSPVSDLSDPFTVLYAGTCKVGDGFLSLLEAIRIARSEGCPVRLQVVGTDGQTGRASKMKQIIDHDSVLKNQVDFLGRVSDEEYPKTLASVDCLVLPRPDKQIVHAAFPTRLPEFLSTGLPVLTTSVPDAPAYLEDGVDAELVEPTPRGLAEGLIRLWQDPERALRIGAAGALKAMDCFDYRKRAEALKAFIIQHL